MENNKDEFKGNTAKYTQYDTPPTTEQLRGVLKKLNDNPVPNGERGFNVWGWTFTKEQLEDLLDENN